MPIVLSSRFILMQHWNEMMCFWSFFKWCIECCKTTNEHSMLVIKQSLKTVYNFFIYWGFAQILVEKVLIINFGKLALWRKKLTLIQLDNQRQFKHSLRIICHFLFVEIASEDFLASFFCGEMLKNKTDWFCYQSNRHTFPS